MLYLSTDKYTFSFSLFLFLSNALKKLNSREESNISYFPLRNKIRCLHALVEYEFSEAMQSKIFDINPSGVCAFFQITIFCYICRKGDLNS